MSELGAPVRAPPSTSASTSARLMSGTGVTGLERSYCASRPRASTNSAAPARPKTVESAPQRATAASLQHPGGEAPPGQWTAERAGLNARTRWSCCCAPLRIRQRPPPAQPNVCASFRQRRGIPSEARQRRERRAPSAEELRTALRQQACARAPTLAQRPSCDGTHRLVGLEAGGVRGGGGGAFRDGRVCEQRGDGAEDGDGGGGCGGCGGIGAWRHSMRKSWPLTFTAAPPRVAARRGRSRSQPPPCGKPTQRSTSPPLPPHTSLPLSQPFVCLLCLLSRAPARPTVPRLIMTR